MSQIGNHFPTDQGKNKKILPRKTKMSAEAQWLEDVFPGPFLAGHVRFCGV